FDEIVKLCQDIGKIPATNTKATKEKAMEAMQMLLSVRRSQRETIDQARLDHFGEMHEYRKIQLDIIKELKVKDIAYVNKIAGFAGDEYIDDFLIEILDSGKNEEDILSKVTTLSGQRDHYNKCKKDYFMKIEEQDKFKASNLDKGILGVLYDYNQDPLLDLYLDRLWSMALFGTISGESELTRSKKGELVFEPLSK
ncbi:MAG: hypothetical protein V1843_04800, partial [bacterium]